MADIDPPQAKLAYTVKEAADVLACSIDHVYNLIAKGDLKRSDISVGPKAKTRVMHKHLVEFLEKREVPPLRR